MLSRISFLGGITEQQRSVIYRHLEAAHFNKGEYIARRGEEPSHIFIIRAGSVHLIIGNEDINVTKRTFGAGDCFGEAALLSLINNTASFVAAEDSELVVFSRKAFNSLRKEDPDIFLKVILNIARELARKLQFSDERLLRPDDT